MRFFGVVALTVAACGGGTGDGWSPIGDGPTLMNATHVWAFSETNVWVLDGSATVQTFDGTAWSPFQTPATSGLGCIYALSATEVWLCSDGTMLHYDGTSFTMTDVMTPTGLSGLTAAWASAPNDVWAVGMDAIVAHYDGTTWTRQVVGEPNKSSIWGSSATDVYALGTFDLSHYDGSAWTQVQLDGGGGDGQVWGTAANDVWVMPGSEPISHFDGTAWQSVELNLVGDFAAVWGTAANDLWAAGDAGEIAHYNGTTWNEVSHQAIGAPYLRQLLSVHGTSSADVWIVGHELGQGGAKAIIYHGP